MECRQSTTPPQSGVIPYRREDDHVEFLLITSRTRRRWIIPKGNIEDELTSARSAAKEAFEEAGVQGHVPEAALGSYMHGVPPDNTIVQVHLMEVTRELGHWPEDHQRRRHWFAPEEALRRVYEEGLRDLLQHVVDTLGGRRIQPLYILAQAHPMYPYRRAL